MTCQQSRTDPDFCLNFFTVFQMLQFSSTPIQLVPRRASQALNSAQRSATLDTELGDARHGSAQLGATRRLSTRRGSARRDSNLGEARLEVGTRRGGAGRGTEVS